MIIRSTEIDPNVAWCHFDCPSCTQKNISGCFAMMCTKDEFDTLNSIWKEYMDSRNPGPDFNFLKCPRGHSLNIIDWRTWEPVDMDGYPITGDTSGYTVGK